MASHRSFTVVTVQEELEGTVERIPEATASAPQPSALPGETAEGTKATCDITELRVELDLAQLDHPSRWAKLSR